MEPNHILITISLLLQYYCYYIITCIVIINLLFLHKPPKNQVKYKGEKSSDGEKTGQILKDIMNT